LRQPLPRQALHSQPLYLQPNRPQLLEGQAQPTCPPLVIAALTWLGTCCLPLPSYWRVALRCIGAGNDRRNNEARGIGRLTHYPPPTLVVVNAWLCKFHTYNSCVTC